MKFPWSKKKYPYTPHSAPITNGILRNGKWAAATDRPRNCDNVHVTFSIRRTGSAQMSQDAINEATERGLERSRTSKSSYPGKKSRPQESKEFSRSRNTRKNNDKKAERSERHRNEHCGRGDSSSTRLERRGVDIDDSTEAFDSFEKSRRRLSEIPVDKFASSYGKWGSTGTMSTVDTADSDMEGRSPSRTRLSELLDRKIEAKMLRKAKEAKESSNTDAIPPC